MKNLLKFEIYNMLRQKIVYVAAVIMLVLLYLVDRTSDGRLEYYLSIGYGAEDMIVGILTTCFFTYFIAVIVSFVVCRDYEHGVIKNIYAKGYSHETVYSAKFIFTLLLVTVIYAITMVFGTVQAKCIFGWGKTDIADIMIAQYIAVLAYAAFYNLFCQIFKKSGYAIAFLILVPSIGGLLLDILDSYIGVGFSFGDLWITQTMAYIHGGTVTGKEIALSIITSFVYIFGCFFAGRKLSGKM